MKKLIPFNLVALLYLLFSLSAYAGSNVMKIHDVTADPGDVITVEFEVINDDPFNGLQLDIPLPTGFTYVPGSAQLNPARSNDHIIMTNVLSSGALRLIAFHMSNANFLGNDGIVATFQLETPNIPGIHTLNMTNATLSGAGGNILTGTIPGTVTLEGDIPQATLTMSFNGSGGASVNGTPYTTPVTVNQGTTLTVEALADSGWEFDNWSGDLAGDDSPTTILMDGDKQVTANFSEIEPTQYILTININGEGEVRVNGTPYTEPVQFNEGATVFLNAVPDAGWQFDNWSGDLTGTHPLTNITMNDDKTVDAHFSVSTTPQYTLTMSFEGEGDATVNGIPYTEPMLFNEGEIVELIASPDEGWQFDNWSGDLTGDASPTTILMDDNKEVTANFSEVETEQYTLTINIFGEGLVQVNGTNYAEPIDFDEGTIVMLEAIPFEGWQFGNWSGSITGTLPATTITLDDDKTVNANFTAIPESDNIMQINDETGEGGTIIDLELEVINDDEFVGFQTDIYLPAGFSYVEGSASLNPARASDHFLDANIMPDGTLRLVSASFFNTAYLGNDGPVVFFSLTTPPAAGDYTIALTDPVISDVDGDNILTDAFDGTITLTEPQIIIHTITAGAGPGGNIQPEGVVEVDDGQDQMFLITPDEGHHIDVIAVDGTAIDLNDDPAWDAAAGQYTFTDVQQDHTIQATFSINTYTLIYVAGENGTVNGELQVEQEVEHGADGTPVEAMPNEGYFFVEWSDGLTDNPRTDENITGDLTVTAEFAINVYTILYIAGANGTIDGQVQVEQQVEHGADGTPVEAMPAEGYQFVAWSDGVTDNPRTDENVTDDISVTALFTINTYTILYMAGENGTLDGETEQIVEHGQGGSPILAIPDVGYEFAGWDDGVADNPRTDENVTEDIIATALFEMVDYTLTVTILPEDAGSIVVAPDQEFYNIGDEITLTATPIEGYEFQNWRLDGVVIDENNPLLFEMPADDVTLEAHFVEEETHLYDITLIPNPADGGTVSGSGSFANGESATVTAVASEGYSFVGWREGNTFWSRDAEYTFEVTRDRELFAHFTLKRYTITLDMLPEDGTGGAVKGSGTFTHGTEVTVRARPNMDYSFDGWTEDENIVSTALNYTFTITGDRHLVAIFSGNTYIISVNPNPAEGGSVSGGGTYNEGAVVAVEAESSDNYFFLRWMDDLQGQVSLQNPYRFTASADRNLTAEFWGPVTPGAPNILDNDMVLVTASVIPAGTGLVFGDGFNPITGEGSYTEGTEVSLLASPNAGIDFVHWLEGDIIVGTDMTYTFTATENVDLIAVFDGETYTVTVEADPEAGGNPTVSNDGEFFFGEFAQLHANVNPGYHFINWTENDAQVSVLPDYGFTVTDNVGLVANFETLDEYLLTLLADPANAGTVSGSGSYEEGTEVTITAAENPGYTFTYWGLGTDIFSEDSEVTFIIEEDLTLVAYFQINSYTLTLNADPIEGGDVFGAGVYLFNETVEVDAVPNEGWEFVEWTDGDGNFVSDQAFNEITIPADDLTLIANFTMIDYTLTLVANPTDGGVVTGAGVYNFGDQVDVDAIPNEGRAFVNWTDADGNEVSDQPDNTITMPSDDLTLTANFEMIDYTLTLTANPTEGGVVTGAGVYNFGDQVDVDAIPNEGWEFVNWTDADGNEVSDQPDNTILMPSGDLTLIAHFELLTYTLTFIVQDAITGTTINEAIITLNGIDYESGEYVFEGMLPETYIYMVAYDGYFDYEGEIEIIDADVVVHVDMLIDDTSVSEIADHNIMVYPNPANSVVHIDSEASISELRLIDLSGQTVALRLLNDSSYTLDISNIRSGLYLLRITTGSGAHVFRLQVTN